MRFAMSLIAGLIFTGSVQADPARCGIENKSDPKLYSSDLAWNQPFTQLMQVYDHIYQSGKRLPKRAYWDLASGSYLLPYHHGTSQTVKISADFVATVRTHIEKALVRKYADAILFSDLGHSHMLIPQNKFKSEYANIPVERMNEFYTTAFADREILFLYHTAEQLNTQGSDLHLTWRQYTRNLVGENRADGEVHVRPGYHEKGHTLREIDGYEWFSSGFNISASKNGCFSFSMPDGSLRYFDISLYDLEPESNSYRVMAWAEAFKTPPPPTGCRMCSCHRLETED